MFDVVSFLELSAVSPYAFLPEMPAGIVAHGAAAVIAYRQHRPDWSLMGSKYLLLATAGMGITIGGYLAAGQQDLPGVAICIGIGIVAGAAFSIPPLRFTSSSGAVGCVASMRRSSASLCCGLIGRIGGRLAGGANAKGRSCEL